LFFVVFVIRNKFFFSFNTNCSNDDVQLQSAMQRDALSIASPRFVEQPDLQSIPNEKIPLPFPFNQEELSKIEEILKLQPVQEIPIIKKKRHGRRGKLLGKISRM
jgi:sialic acid synthase SpsE